MNIFLDINPPPYPTLPLLWLSLSLQASRQCQSKEKVLDQRFRSAYRDFQQWLVNAKINTAKSFDVPQNLSEASSSLQKIQVCQRETERDPLAVSPQRHRKLIQSPCLLRNGRFPTVSLHLLVPLQEFVSDREQGQSKLNSVVVCGELVNSVAVKERVEAVLSKICSAREDWKTLMSNLHQRETALQVRYLDIYIYLDRYLVFTLCLFYHLDI